MIRTVKPVTPRLENVEFPCLARKVNAQSSTDLLVIHKYNEDTVSLYSFKYGTFAHLPISTFLITYELMPFNTELTIIQTMSKTS